MRGSGVISMTHERELEKRKHIQYSTTAPRYFWLGGRHPLAQKQHKHHPIAATMMKYLLLALLVAAASAFAPSSLFGISRQSRCVDSFAALAIVYILGLVDQALGNAVMVRRPLRVTNGIKRDTLIAAKTMSTDSFAHTFAFQLLLPIAFFNLVSTACFAKHVNDKGARKSAAKRPKKSRLSDINRKPVVYELQTLIKPAECTIEES